MQESFKKEEEKIVETNEELTKTDESSTDQSRQLQNEPGISESVSSVETPTYPFMSPKQEKWFEQYREEIAAIPDSNGSRYYEKLNLRIGIICDEIFYDSIKAAADFVYLTPENWKDVIYDGLDALLFVSAWRGIHNEWFGLAALNSLIRIKERKTAFDILDYCHEKSIPTVFYSKEDPPNYEIFLDFAKRCDYIFTSASECIPFYIKDCGNVNVDAVTFGINPELHNPIGFRKNVKEKTILFSGSWTKKYPERCAELSVIFDGILTSSYNLHIVNRNYPQYLRTYQFPKRYFPYTSPAIDHQELQKVHKLFDWAVNINSVKTSETMFANRGFELQACGILLLSNYSVGVNSLLPTIYMVHDAKEISHIVNSMTDEEIYEHQIAGIRSVMTGHTCYDRINQLLSPCGLASAQPQRRILVIVEEITDYITERFEHQTYPYKQLMEERAVTEKILLDFDMVTWFSDKAYYGNFYLEDMANGFKYTAADYITKDAWYSEKELNQGIEHDYVNQMRSKYRTLFWRAAYTFDFLMGIEEGSKALDNGYSIDHFSYNAVIPQMEKKKEKYLLSVIVPIYNNGAHLYGKCFSSLCRSSMFQDMEIIFVDDGSTDERTLRIEEDIQERYSNVLIYSFQDGGSGSASRPRNKGVELASAEYITFLDPDNEAVCDGYAKLYDIATKDDFDLVIGNMYRCEIDTRVVSNYNSIYKKIGTNIIMGEFSESLFIETNFPAISIQAMVIRKRIIIDNCLEEVVGAAGQDTLFAWQLLRCSHSTKAVDLPIHVYYAQTSGSVTNVVKPKYFERLFLLQQPKLDWLKENNLLVPFMSTKYDFYTTHWILNKLSISVDAENCAMVVERILDIYSDYYHGTDDLINTFLSFCKQKDYSSAVECVKKAFPYIPPMPVVQEKPKNPESQKKPSVMKVEYKQSGSSFTFYNRTKNDSSALYTWVILLAEGAYQKIYTAKYTEDISFTYDFANAESKLYKVRAFIKAKDGETKLSEDVAYIKVEKGKAELLKGKSSAVPEKKGRVKIREIDVFDLYGDGTLVMKTNLEKSEKNLSYAWHVIHDGDTIYKSSYQQHPFTTCKVEQQGLYLVKAMVKNAEGENVVSKVNLTLNQKTSPKLSKNSKAFIKITPYVEHISGLSYKMDILETLPEGVKFAWYIHKAGSDELMMRKMYTDISEYIYSFKEPGKYYVKAFIIIDNVKHIAKSDVFVVN